MISHRRGLFTAEDGKSLAFTFVLVTWLFLLWGVCNGMIDVMDKHFQTELGLSKAQSAWVQFAHYLGYFLMAMPAGWLATRLGYKGGIIAGLLMVAVGGFWFVPATYINGLAHAGRLSPATAFVGYLVGVCVVAAGLTFLMSIMLPTIFALGIFGLGSRAKMASSFIVMAIMGGAILPKLMGAVADRYDMSRGFIVPLGCFVVAACYGYLWPRLAKADSLNGLRLGSGHAG